MMAVLFRLRWRLAHLICPELGVEARLKVATAQQHARQRSSLLMSASQEPFLPADQMSELVALLRHGRVERAKEILKIVQSVQLHGLPGDDDAALDALAKRFAFFVFGKN